MSQSRETIRVLIADDHTLFAEALTLTLEIDPRLQVVGHATNGAQAVTLAEVLEPDVVLMDLQMPVMDGIEATRLVLRVSPRTRVLMISASAVWALASSALAAGASRFLTKDTPALAVIDAVVDVASKEAKAASIVPFRPRLVAESSGRVA